MDIDLNSLSIKEVIALCESSHDFTTGILRISKDIIIKFGVDITPAEFANQRYIWENRNILSFHVPRPHRYFRDDSKGPYLSIGYIIMEFIHGTQLSTYLESANDCERDEVVTRMLKILEDLKRVPQPSGQPPGPVGGGSLRGYLWSECGLNHAFQDVTEFEDFHNGIIEKTYGSDDKLSFTAYGLILCHMDLAPRNIIRLSDGRLAVLDWAYAGFYPPIFEVYALRTRSNREPIFARVLDQIPQGAKLEQQIALLGLVEAIFFRRGDIINCELEQNACGSLACSGDENSMLLDF